MSFFVVPKQRLYRKIPSRLPTPYDAERTPGAFVAGPILPTMFAQTLRANPKLALVTNPPVPGLWQQLSTALARDHVVGGHSPAFPIAS